MNCFRFADAPVCADPEITVIGASLDEVLKVRCHVTADPSDVTFVWQFNNSGESFDVSPARFSTTAGNTSELEYTPASQRDYGTLTCWGENTIGRQLEPCVFQVVPAGKSAGMQYSNIYNKKSIICCFPNGDPIKLEQPITYHIYVIMICNYSILLFDARSNYSDLEI